MSKNSEFIRIGTDRGASVEVTLRPGRHGKPGEKSVVIRTPTGTEFKYDHPKDVSEFLKLSLAEILGITDNLVNESLATARAITKSKRSGKARMLELV